MTVPNFMSKAFFYWDLRRLEGGGEFTQVGGGGGALCVAPPPQGMIRQKYPGADRVKNSEYNTVK